MQGLISGSGQVVQIRGRDLHGVEQGRGFLGLDAAVQHHLADFRDGRLDGDGVSELREVDVEGRVGLGVVDVGGRWAGVLVVIAKSLVEEGGRAAGISVHCALFTEFDWRFAGRR